MGPDDNVTVYDNKAESKIGAGKIGQETEEEIRLDQEDSLGAYWPRDEQDTKVPLLVDHIYCSLLLSAEAFADQALHKRCFEEKLYFLLIQYCLCSRTTKQQTNIASTESEHQGSSSG